MTYLPSEIGKLENITALYIAGNQLTQLPPEIGELKKLTTLCLCGNQLTELPPEIGKLKNLTKLYLSENHLTQLPLEIGELKNLTELYLSKNLLVQLPPEIGKLKNLTKLYLSENHLTQLPLEIGELKNLTELYLSKNLLVQLPPEITELNKLIKLDLSENPLISPPPEVVSMGLHAIFTYLKNPKTTENNEAKLILVGDARVGKTCLVHRLITDKFLEDSKITEGINISKWKIPSPVSGKNEIKLNIWDFGGQEIYHATHQFFLTTRSAYLLVWNAKKKEEKNDDFIYYWLHTIEAFGEDSPIILVMSKMNENDDDLNLKQLKSRFPQIVDSLKIDSKDGEGIYTLRDRISKTAWNSPLMRTPWVDSWYRIRERLEKLGNNWVPFIEFYKTCVSEGLDDKNIIILDGYLHELGVILHFKDRIALKNIVILKPEWATSAFYKILSAKSVLHREGILLESELAQIWDEETYSSAIHYQLMELMNKFELSYELDDRNSFLIPELLPKSAPDFEWDEEDNLLFYYCYDSFLPPGIIPRLIVRMHQNLEKKKNGLPLCWREGAVLKFQDSLALVVMNTDIKQIVIRIKGVNKRWVLGAICCQLDQISSSLKKINVRKQIPCNCSKNCRERYLYEKILQAEMNGVVIIRCLESFENVSVSSLLDGNKWKEEGVKEYDEFSRQPRQTVIIKPTISPTISPTFNPVFSPSVKANADSNQTTEAKLDANVNMNVIFDLKIDLPQIQTDFDNLRREIAVSNPELKEEMDEIQDSLDEVSADDEKDKLKKPLNKVRRFFIKLGDPKSDYNKMIVGTQKGTELLQKAVDAFNKVAPALGILALHGLH